MSLVDLARSRPPKVDVPTGRPIAVPGRGRVFVWERPGPAGAPTVVLIHGLVASGGLNWFPSMPVLAKQFNVVAVDLPGHGRSMRVGTSFRLAACADDVAAVTEAVGIDRFIAVGYSLGGPVAQLLWHRHRDRVAGMVLCATSRNFGGTTPERMFYAGLLGGVLGIQAFNALPLPWKIRPSGADDRVRPADDRDPLIARWALDELRRTDVLSAVSAMAVMGRFSSHEWVGGIDVPVSVVVTTRDHLISTTRQLKLAQAIDGATVHPVAAGHAACVIGRESFVPVLVDAVRSVAGRAGFRLLDRVDEVGEDEPAA